MYTFSHANIMHMSKEIIVLKDILSILSFFVTKRLALVAEILNDIMNALLILRLDNSFFFKTLFILTPVKNPSNVIINIII